MTSCTSQHCRTVARTLATFPSTPTRLGPAELHQHGDPSGAGPGAGLPGGLGGGPGGPGGPLGPGADASCTLPDSPELSNLEVLARALSEVSLFQRDRMAAQLGRPGYLAKLLDIFRVRRRKGCCRAGVLGGKGRVGDFVMWRLSGAGWRDGRREQAGQLCAAAGGLWRPRVKSSTMVGGGANRSCEVL